MNQLKDIEVLNVDDDATMRQLVSGVVRSEGGKCLVAIDGNSCMAQIEQHPGIQVVVLDYNLSVTETGSDIAARIKQVRQNLPIILHTSEPLGQNLAEGDKNFDGFLKKPLAPQTLVAAIREILQKKGLM